MPKIGEINTFKVLRETDISFLLDSPDGELFLHKNESNYQKLKAGSTVSAFLYFDQKGRLAATLKTPYITVSKPAFLEVVDVLENLGVFLDMGINKDLLLSKDDLPLNKELWPQIGDQIYVRINVKGKMVAKIVDVNELPNNENLVVGTFEEFYVQKIGQQGVNFLNKNLDTIFVHESMIRDTLRIGQKLSVKVLNLTEKGYSGSIMKQKEELRFDDAFLIMNYLKRYQKMPLTSKSSSQEIEKVFKISKKAFKRALGLLYKERKIDFIENETITILLNGDKDE